jgi:outer membrane protein TolC
MAQLEEFKARIEAGAAAPADQWALRSRLAALEEIVISAAAQRDKLAIALETLTGDMRDSDRRLSPDLSENPPDTPKTDQGAASEWALENSPAVRQAAAGLYAAQERARTAGESMRQKLDLMGWIMAQTMGVDRVSPLVTQLGDGPAYSAYLGISYELPLSSRRKDAQQATAQVEVEIARSKLVAATNQARGEVATATRAVESARQRVELARQTLEVAEQQAEAVRQRASLGAAIYVEVRDAEETVREAALRIARAQVDLVVAGLTLDHLTGALLTKTSLAQ